MPEVRFPGPPRRIERPRSSSVRSGSSWPEGPWPAAGRSTATTCSALNGWRGRPSWPWCGGSRRRREGGGRRRRRPSGGGRRIDSAGRGCGRRPSPGTWARSRRSCGRWTSC